MPIDVNELYEFVKFVANKEQSGYIKPDEFNLVADRAQMQFFMERYNNPAEYQPGRPIPRVAFQQSQKVSDDLRIFVTSEDVSSGDDISALNDDYVHLVSLRTTTDRHVKLLDDAELGHVLNSALTPPSSTYPVAYIVDDQINIVPNTTTCTITYLRRPAKPEWVYFQDADGNPTDATGINPLTYPVYDEASSTNLEFPDETFNEIAIRILSFVGINLRENQLSQFAELKKQQGI